MNVIPINCIHIVATDPDGIIGVDGDLPWHYPEDLKFFQRVTKGHIVVMGRITYESIGKPLQDRLNIVVSSSAKPENYPSELIWFTPDPNRPLDESLSEFIRGLNVGNDVFVTGGARLYEETSSLCTAIIRTNVPKVIVDDQQALIRRYLDASHLEDFYHLRRSDLAEELSVDYLCRRSGYPLFDDLILRIQPAFATAAWKSSAYAEPEDGSFNTNALMLEMVVWDNKGLKNGAYYCPISQTLILRRDPAHFEVISIHDSRGLIILGKEQLSASLYRFSTKDEFAALLPYCRFLEDHLASDDPLLQTHAQYREEAFSKNPEDYERVEKWLKFARADESGKKIGHGYVAHEFNHFSTSLVNENQTRLVVITHNNHPQMFDEMLKHGLEAMPDSSLGRIDMRLDFSRTQRTATGVSLIRIWVR